ncbi:hypothetical protein AB9P05_14055 [Roseivirga sp. BDSF3-8]
MNLKMLITSLLFTIVLTSFTSAQEVTYDAKHIKGLEEPFVLKEEGG